MAGRKNKYETHVKPKLELIQNWCKDGLIELEICKRLGVGVSTFAKYKNDNSELREALKNGKEEIDYMVENALLKRALGHKIKELKKTTNEEGEESMVEIIKEVPAEVVACIFWLKNRKPEKWRDKPKEQVEDTSDPVKLAEALLKMSDEEIKTFQEALKK